MKPLFSSYLIGGLFAAFTLMVAAGIALVFIAVTAPGAVASTDAPQSKSKVDVTISPGKVKFDMTTGIPGLVIVGFGGVGLLLLAIRVPMKQVRGYRRPPRLPPGAVGLMSPDFLAGPQPIVSDQTERVPLLLSWFVGDRAVRV